MQDESSRSIARQVSSMIYDIMRILAIMISHVFIMIITDIPPEIEKTDLISTAITSRY